MIIFVVGEEFNSKIGGLRCNSRKEIVGNNNEDSKNNYYVNLL